MENGNTHTKKLEKEVVNPEIKHISDIIGEWGRWQSLLFANVFLAWAASAIHHMGYAFHAFSDFQIRCTDGDVI